MRRFAEASAGGRTSPYALPEKRLQLLRAGLILAAWCVAVGFVLLVD